MNGKFGNNHFSTFGRQQKHQQQYKIIIINLIIKKMQGSGPNWLPGHRDGQSAPASGYNQVPVAEGDNSKTAFCTPFGLFEWNRMPFDLCNAPGTFQRLMERLFGDQQCQSLLLYLDDIVFSSSVDQHLARMEVVLSRLQTEGLKAKLSKCAFF